MEMTLPVSFPPVSIGVNDLSCSLETLYKRWQCLCMKSAWQVYQISNSGGNIALSIPGNKGVDLRLSGQKVSARQVILTEAWIQWKEKLNGGEIPVTVRAGGSKLDGSLNRLWNV